LDYLLCFFSLSSSVCSISTSCWWRIYCHTRLYSSEAII